MRTVEFARCSFLRVSHRLSSMKPVLNGSVTIRKLVTVAPLCDNQRRQDLPVSCGRPESSVSSLARVIQGRVVYDITHDTIKISPYHQHRRYFTRFSTQCSINVKAFRLITSLRQDSNEHVNWTRHDTGVGSWHEPHSGCIVP